MDIAIRKYQRNYIIDVKGDLDLYNAFRLKEAVQRMIDADARVLILNMKDVDYVDSSGIGALLSINRLLAKDGRKLRIASVTQTVQNLMNITGLARVPSDLQNRGRGDRDDRRHRRWFEKAASVRVARQHPRESPGANLFFVGLSTLTRPFLFPERWLTRAAQASAWQESRFLRFEW